MAKTAPNKAAKLVIHDEARRCEHRLNALVRKMKAERNTRGALTILGGSATLAGSFAAAIKSEDTGDQGAKLTAAIVAALGGLVALTAPLVGEPANEMEQYAAAVSHYEAARAHADTFAKKTSCPSDCYLLIRQELSMCNDATGARK